MTGNGCGNITPQMEASREWAELNEQHSSVRQLDKWWPESTAEEALAGKNGEAVERGGGGGRDEQMAGEEMGGGGPGGT
jgi:hypothetical protein